MDHLLKYLEKHFNESDLSTSEFRLSGEYYLRFELGDPHKNGTIERVNQSVKRAVTIFEEIFDENDDICLFIKSGSYDVDSTKGLIPINDHLENQLKNFSYQDVSQRTEVEIEEEEVYDFDKDGNLVVVDADDLTHVLTCLCLKQKDIRVENIIRGIANYDMGFTPSIVDRIYFINTDAGVVFYMYDDRGCLLFSDRKDALEPLYTKFNNWLVDYDRKNLALLFE